VFVHGLRGDSFQTWMAPNGACWPRDFLPIDIPQARILTYGYNSDYFSVRFLMQNILWEQGKALLEYLVKARSQPSEKRRAIVFVAHSLGGILVKSALIQADVASIDEDNPTGAVIRSTTAVVFFGTPHRGSSVESWSQIIEKIVSITTISNNQSETLEPRSILLQEQLQQFAELGKNLQVTNFYETRRMDGPRGRLVVNQDVCCCPLLLIEL
jgi:hypothetical protein